MTTNVRQLRKSESQARGAHVRKMREDMGLTQTELASQLDVAMNSVWRWETNGAPLVVELAVTWLSAKRVMDQAMENARRSA